MRAVLASPSILLLDEPTASLDPETRGQVMGYLHRWVAGRQDRGLVLVSHAEEDGTMLPPGNVIHLRRPKEVETP